MGEELMAHIDTNFAYMLMANAKADDTSFWSVLNSSATLDLIAECNPIPTGIKLGIFLVHMQVSFVIVCWSYGIFIMRYVRYIAYGR